jgi:hypothetical protein
LIHEIYVAALPLPAEQRAQYLQQHCPDSGVREDVERMLASDVTQTYSRSPDIAEPALRLRPSLAPRRLFPQRPSGSTWHPVRVLSTIPFSLATSHKSAFPALNAWGYVCSRLLK